MPVSINPMPAMVLLAAAAGAGEVVIGDLAAC